LVVTGMTAATVAGRLSRLGRIEEFNVFTFGQPTAGTWGTVHARCAHGIDKMAVGGGIPRLYGRPALLVGFVSKVRLHGKSPVNGDDDARIRGSFIASTPILAVNGGYLGQGGCCDANLANRCSCPRQSTKAG